MRELVQKARSKYKSSIFRAHHRRAAGPITLKMACESIQDHSNRPHDLSYRLDWSA